MAIKIGAAPAASDDKYVFSEDYGLQAAGGLPGFTTTLNVRSNDGKSSGRPLYSLDNGQVADLAVRDLASNVATSPDRSALGATIWINADGTVGYSTAAIGSMIESLAPGETLEDSFLYATQHPNGSLLWSTVRITITGTNDVPIARVDQVAAAEDTLTQGTVASNDSDVDNGAVLTFAATNAAEGFAMAVNGSWALDTSAAIYQSLAAGQTEQIMIGYRVTDEFGATSVSQLVITVSGSNDTPEASAISVQVEEDGSLSGRIIATDDDHGDILSFAIVGDAPAGLILGTDGNWTLDASDAVYQSLSAGETLILPFAYSATDQAGASSSSSLTITVTGTNDGPIVGLAPNALANEGGTPVLIDALASASDADADATLSVVNLPSLLPHGVTFDSETATFRLDPGVSAYNELALGQTFVVTVDYGISDGAATTPASVSWTVTGTNDAPIVEALADTIYEDAIVHGRLRASDPDEGAALTYSFVGTVPPGVTLAANGSVTIDTTGAGFQYLGADDSEVASIVYRAVDEHGAESTAVWTLTLRGRNDVPVLSGSAATLPMGAHDQAYTVSESELLTGWTDVDGDRLSVINVSADHGTVTRNGAGSFATYTITPEAGYSGAVQLNYLVSDGTALASANVSFTLRAGATIGGTTSGSVVEARNFNAGTPDASGQLTIEDQGGSPLFQAVVNPTLSASGYGRFTITAEGAWRYTLDNASSAVNRLDTGQTLSDTFTVLAADGTAQLIGVTITGATDWVVTGPYGNTNDPNDFDTVKGAAGTDNFGATVVGTSLRDVVTGGSVDQTFDMQGGNDTVYGQSGDDLVYAGAGDDYIMGQAGNDVLLGDLGNDYLYGGTGHDRIEGGDGFDQLYGGSGLDTILGGGGRDIIIGGFNVDTLTGGADGDTFIYNSLFDSGDIITDFQFGLDGVDLRAIDPNAQLSGDQAFAFSSNGAAAYSVWLVQNGAAVELYGDTDGYAGTAEFMIAFNNTSWVSSSAPANFFL